MTNRLETFLVLKHDSFFCWLAIFGDFAEVWAFKYMRVAILIVK